MDTKVLILAASIPNQFRALFTSVIEGGLEVKLPTIICRDGKAGVGRVSEEKSRSEKIRDGESQKREDAGARKGREVAIHCVFPMICGSGGSKSNLAKAAGAEPAGQMRDEKVHAVVARSTFPSQKGKSTSRSEHFWKLRCQKSARRCGAKHVSKSKCTRHANVGPLLEAEMSKKCTPLWREAHFQVKMVKAPHVRTTCTPLWREAHFQVKNGKSTTCSDHFLTFRCRKSARCCGTKHISKSKV